MDKKKRNILVIVILIIMLAGAGSAGTVYYYFFSRQFNLSKTAYIYIDRDDNLDSIYSKIESTGHPKTMYGFKFQAERGNYGENIRTGRYAIRPEDNMRYLYRRLSMGYQTPVKRVFGKRDAPGDRFIICFPRGDFDLRRVGFLPRLAEDGKNAHRLPVLSVS